jgi:hypothetical protein
VNGSVTFTTEEFTVARQKRVTGDASFIGDYHDLWTWTYTDETWGVDS